MKRKRIWIVAELFHPEETAVAFIFTRIANFLSQKYDVSVICGPESYDNNKKNFKDSYKHSPKVVIYRTKTFLRLDKNSLIQRALKVIFLSLQMAFLMFQKISKGEVVLLATHPAPILLIAGFIKKWKKIQLHILVHDVFPENTIPAQIFKSNKSIVYRFLKHIFDKAYSKADHLIVIGRDMKEVLLEKTERFNKSQAISVVPNWTNPSIIKPGVKASKGEYDGKIVLQYSGNIGRVQALEQVLEALISSNNPNIFLILRGTGALYTTLEKIISSRNLSNVSLLGGYSRNEENKILATCDISIVSLSKGMYGLGVPSKTYNSLAAGKPILFLGDLKSEISLLVKENNIGWAFDINSRTEIVNFFNKLQEYKRPEIIEKGMKARWLAENQFEEKKILLLLQKQIEDHLW